MLLHPVLVDVACGDVLRQFAGAQVGRLLHAHENIHERVVGYQHSQPQASGEHLGEGDHQDHPPAVIQAADRGERLPGEAKLSVRIVLEDQQILPSCDLEQALALLQRHGDPARILEIRDHVDRLQRLSRRARLRDLLFKYVQVHTVIFQRDRDLVGLEQAERL